MAAEGSVTSHNQRRGRQERFRDEIKNAYADCWMGWEKGSHIRSLDYRSRAQLTVMEAAALMAEAVPDGYNEFQAAVILELPDTARVEIAREGSVCLYVWNAGLAACRKLEADECHKQDDGSIRCWWD